ncbi:MAG: outer membrane lipid asymmetry maintenance protein MlaD [Planctomycetes bacterium]|nr:outer membrane lipid asymmetry maintenance protein MlaD [Planctomycetota bacterium]
MSKGMTEVFVGLFMVIGFICFSIVAVKFGSESIFMEEGYGLHASFDSISGLKKGSLVEIAGVPVGKVVGISLHEGRAKVDIRMNNGIQVEDDCIASIRTKGIIGEKYIKLISGISEEYLTEGGEIIDTEPVLDIEELIGKFIYK